MYASPETPPQELRPRVLLVCDRPQEIARWSRLLPGKSMDLIPAGSLDRALEIWSESVPDLALIDVNASQPDGIEICRQLRPEASVPLLVVMDECDEDCQLQAYRAGADDCLVRPFSPALFQAKLDAWLRRSWTVPAEALAELEAGGVHLDPILRAVIFESGRIARLTNLEFRLLSLLMSNPGRALQPDDIVQRVWGFSGGGVESVMLKNVVYRLRKKVEPDPAHPVYLLTEPGLGYRFRKSLKKPGEGTLEE
jgi:two-component system, OmpR family, KDP operon response regulator KdpE